MKDKIFIKEVEYDWDNYYPGGGLTYISIFFFIFGIFFFVGGDYKSSATSFFIGINLVSVLANIFLIRKGIWRNKK